MDTRKIYKRWQYISLISLTKSADWGTFICLLTICWLPTKHHSMNLQHYFARRRGIIFANLCMPEMKSQGRAVGWFQSNPIGQSQSLNHCMFFWRVLMSRFVLACISVHSNSFWKPAQNDLTKLFQILKLGPVVSCYQLSSDNSFATYHLTDNIGQ